MENQDAFNAWCDNEVFSGRDPGRCHEMCYTIQGVQPEHIKSLKEMLKINNLITKIEPLEAQCTGCLSLNRQRKENSMDELKLCPLKSMTAESVREQLALKCLGEDEVGMIGKCDGHLCAWWDAERNCCGVVAGNKR